MKRRILVSLAMLFLAVNLAPMTTYSSDEVVTEHSPQDLEIELRRNITGYIYKIYNGRQWKRLWSYTYNKWVDSYWSLA